MIRSRYGAVVLWRGNEAKLDCTGDNVIAVVPMMRLALEVKDIR